MQDGSPAGVATRIVKDGPPRAGAGHASRRMWIDILRAASILLVLGLHYFGFFIFAQGEFSGWQRGFAKLFGHGYFGVTIFFVISGYLIANTSIVRAPRGDAIKVAIWPFYARRVTRILPLLAAVVAIGAVAAQFAPRTQAFHLVFMDELQKFDSQFWLSIATFSFNWLRIAAATPEHAGFGMQWDVLWSLAVEEQFYLCFPLAILAIGSAARLKRALVGLIILAAALRMYFIATGHDGLFVTTNSLTCIDALALGVLVNFLPESWQARRRWLAPVAVLLMTLCYLAGYGFALGLATTFMGVGAALFILAMAGAPAASGRILGFVARTGQLSFGLYLLHPLVLYLFAGVFFALPPVVGFALYVGLTIVAAQISFAWLEKPVEVALRRRLLGARPAVAPIEAGAVAQA